MELEKFEIKQTLPALVCDYDSLKQWAESMTAKYDGLVITEEQIPEIKKDMAALNKARQKLERARIDAVKAVSAPIREFEAQIKQVCGIFDTTYGTLGEQVRAYELAAKEEKRKKIQAVIDEEIALAIADNPKMDDMIALSVQDKWLNKTATMKSIGLEIESMIQEQVRANLEIERREKAEAERRLLIENAVKSANEKYNANAPISQFMSSQFTDISVDAVAVLSRIDGTIKAQAEKEKAAASEAKNALPVDCVDPLSPLLQPAKYARRYQQGDSKTRDSFVAEDTTVYESDFKINGIPIENFLKEKMPEKPNSGMICLALHAYYRKDLEDEVRKILEQNQFMRIVRQLKGMGLRVEFGKNEI